MARKKQPDATPGGEPATPQPTPPAPRPIPIVGLGASAGGLAALERFSANTQPDAGIASDVWRPVGDPVSRLRCDGLADDAAEVPRTFVFEEAAVCGEDGDWYLMRSLPQVDGRAALSDMQGQPRPIADGAAEGLAWVANQLSREERG